MTQFDGIFVTLLFIEVTATLIQLATLDVHKRKKMILLSGAAYAGIAILLVILAFSMGWDSSILRITTPDPSETPLFSESQIAPSQPPSSTPSSFSSNPSPTAAGIAAQATPSSFLSLLTAPANTAQTLSVNRVTQRFDPGKIKVIGKCNDWYLVQTANEEGLYEGYVAQRLLPAVEGPFTDVPVSGEKTWIRADTPLYNQCEEIDSSIVLAYLRTDDIVYALGTASHGAYAYIEFVQSGVPYRGYVPVENIQEIVHGGMENE